MNAHLKSAPLANEANYQHHSRTLKFPREKATDMILSPEAIDLINRILQERQFRLCSQKYQANDMLAGRPVSAQILYSMHPQHRNVTSYFVYPNDAADIKAHPFFRGIRWSELHLIQPPLVPKVKNWEDTRYFDDYKPIGQIDGISNASASEGTEEDHDPDSNPAAADAHDCPANGVNPPDQPVPKPDPAVTAGPEAEKAQEVEEKKQERKRPRDKILRDKAAGKIALGIRKKGAFLGYTYRRPKRPAVALGAERGRQPYSRNYLAELYAI